MTSCAEACPATGRTAGSLHMVGCDLFHSAWAPLRPVPWLDVSPPYCPFTGDGVCTAGCPSNRERACIDGMEAE